MTAARDNGRVQHMRRLAIFDIDGTLTDTNGVDNECFLRAVSEVLQVDVATVDWSDAPHITDSGLLRWLAGRHAQRPLHGREAEGVRARLVQLLGVELQAAPDRFRPIAGAGQILQALTGAGWHVAVATGGWEASARLKLAAIGIEHTGLVLASSSDAETRVEIMEIALRRASRHGGPFQRVVSIGDGLWDVRAAAALGWPFVGIAAGAHAERLTAAGASTILRDLSDVGAICNALGGARAPGETRA